MVNERFLFSDLLLTVFDFFIYVFAKSFYWLFLHHYIYISVLYPFLGNYAFVTLATDDNYSRGAIVLAHSLRRVETKAKLAVLVTDGVTNAVQ